MLELLSRAKDGEGVKSGPLGLAIILVLCVACYFLFKSMSMHMKKVREQFPSQASADQPRTGPPVGAPADTGQVEASAADVPPKSELSP